MNDLADLPTADRDERLARLLDQLGRDQQQGRPPDWDALARQHPDLVDELRQLLNVAQFAEHLAPRGDDSQATVKQSRPARGASPHGPLGDLPRPFGDYELLEEVGRGAMGVVYKAWEPSLQRFVALKMMLRGDQASAADVTRFHGEARSAAG